MTKRALILRADADSEVGAGHLMRCVALAEAARRVGLEPVFLTRTSSPAYLRILEQRGLRAVELTAPAEDEAAFAKARELAGAAAVVVDVYGLAPDYFAQWRGTPTAQLEDFGVRTDAVQLLVNANLYADAALYGEPRPGQEVLAGAEFLLLRDEFLTAPARTPADEVSEVLITVGGADPHQLTERVLRALEGESLGRRHVVVGPGFVHQGALYAYAAEHPEVVVHAAVDDMAALMRRCDLAVSAAGTTLWELFHLGIPNIHLVLAANQARDAAAAHARGLGISLGPLSALEDDALVEAVATLAGSLDARRAMSQLARRAVDGRGAERVCRALLRLA